MIAKIKELFAEPTVLAPNHSGPPWGGGGVIAKIEEVAESNSVSAPSVKLIRYEYFQRT